MRIIAWNANHNGHPKRSFAEAAELLFAQNADLVILSEIARPARKVTRRIDWIGASNPGLGVEARNGYAISLSDLNSRAPALFGAYQVTGPLSFNLVAAWPVHYPNGPSYAQLLQEALTVFGEFLGAKRAMLVGDLNSSTRVSSQTKSHPVFVEQAKALKLESLYHHRNQVAHGDEKQVTYRHNGRGKGRFHLDYCFLSPALLGSAKIEILDGAEWEQRSDHFPLVIDLPESG